MGHKVEGTDYSLEYLCSELQHFREFMCNSAWMTNEKLKARQLATKGLSFVMLNLADGVDRVEAWKLYNCTMREYLSRCRFLKIFS
jgi:hypothetical protein